jgi:hypothetical protein
MYQSLSVDLCSVNTKIPFFIYAEDSIIATPSLIMAGGAQEYLTLPRTSSTARIFWAAVALALNVNWVGSSHQVPLVHPLIQQFMEFTVHASRCTAT